MGKHVQFKFRSAPSPRRRSSCLNFKGEPKWAYPSETEAIDQAARLDLRAGVRPEPYACDDHGWHLGTPRGPETRHPYKADPFALRNVHRLDWLLGEIGERASAQMLAESDGSANRRAAAIERRHRVSVLTSLA